MKVALGLIPLVFSVLLSGCTSKSAEGVQSPTPSKKTFSVFLDLDDRKSTGWGVFNVLLSVSGDRAILYTCGDEKLAQLQDWYGAPAGTGPYIVQGTIDSVKFSTDDVKLLGSKEEVLALPVSVRTNTDGTSSCSLEFTFENVPFDDFPFMVDLSKFKLDPVWFNASESTDGNVHLEIEKLNYLSKYATDY